MQTAPCTGAGRAPERRETTVQLQRGDCIAIPPCTQQRLHSHLCGKPLWGTYKGISCVLKYLQAIESESETPTTRRSPRDLGGQDGGTLCAAVPSRAHPDTGAGYVRRATSVAPALTFSPKSFTCAGVATTPTASGLRREEDIQHLPGDNVPRRPAHHSRPY